MTLSLYPVSHRETILYAGEAQDVDKVVHVFGYTTRVISTKPRQNCFIFPIPTDALLSESNVLTGDSKPSQLIAMARKLSYPMEKGNPSVARMTFGFAQFASRLGDELSQAGLTITDEQESVLSLLGEFYPEFRFAFVVFKVRERYQEVTFWLKYMPAVGNRLFLPTLDGNALSISLTTDVYRKYFVVLSALDMRGGTPFTTSATRQPLTQFLPERLLSRGFEGWYPNADTVSSVANVRASLEEGIHRRPHIGLWYG